ncbi:MULTISPECIES: YeiH family protein [Campylobacter]|uniref:Putative membrane protein, YeiH/YadS family n=1 Tax=Campylobacter porcelli TaxID=1660073 RepID=A0A1X9SYR9_9BACT|nr:MULTISPECIES: putative sulfate exporter family transporter [unclassified Campylobacter]ARR01418.1 putative membrane protein, YeiH/YadS family [Campylobacter sp. RM6137]MCR8678698.1 putative sulfate exporter family transporter [Campylobacter sp. RM19072]MCR8696340.1 putative sulfate exporter family transporter [Campylobacter sp. RM19073]
MIQKIYKTRKIYAATILIILAAISIFLATFLADFGISALIIAVILGALLANTSKKSVNLVARSGILGISTKQILRLGIILYGFKISLDDVLSIGYAGVLSAFIIVFSSFVFGYFICRIFGIDKKLSVLISSGSSICGAAALMATQSIVKASPNAVAIALCSVVVFGSLGMFIYPFILSGIDNIKAGFIIGASLHEVAHVAGASAYDVVAANNAIIIKMLRVLMLAPFLIILSLASGFFLGEKSSVKSNFPYFALWFFVALFCSGFINPQIKEFISLVDNFLLSVAMSALGLTITKKALKNANLKVFIASSLIFLWLIILAFVLANLLF